MSQKFKLLGPEEIREIDWLVLPDVIRQLTLHNLSYLYNHYKQTLELSSKEVYNDKVFWESKILEERNNSKCMYNIKLSERVIFLIEEECRVRNVYERFFA